MPNSEYIQGRNYEYRVLYKLKEQKKSIDGGRFPASKGVCDIWWIDQDGKRNEAQCKHSSKGAARMSPAEMDSLIEYAQNHPDINVWLYAKGFKTPEKVVRIHHE